MQVKIAIIGGGAAGMMAAIAAAKKGADVTIIEATGRIGNKILLTGNGKCNFSNLLLDESCYYCEDEAFLMGIFERFSPQSVKSFFEDAGMLTKDKEGYLYPLGEQASIVLDILRMELKRLDVSILTEKKVTKVIKEKDTFLVYTENNEEYCFDKVIITTGGRSYPKTGSDGNGYKLAKKMGHRIVPTVPALVQLVGNDDFYKMIAGVRTEGSVSLYIDEVPVRTECGEIQFTDYGISGIPVFQLSRLASYGLFENKKVKIIADVLSEIGPDKIKDMVHTRLMLHKDNTLEEFMCGLTNKKLALLAIKQAGYKPQDNVNGKTSNELFEMVRNLKKIVFHITDTKGYATAQVTAGGVAVCELDDNLQSKIVKGLYFAGEMVDVDGICGGYNLQWAFAGGYLAGCDAATEKVNNR